MKKVLLTLSCCAFLVACNNSSSEYGQYYDQDGVDTTAADNTSTSPVPPAPIANDSTPGSATAAGAEESYEQGAKLISFSDCLSCHNETNKLVGPAYVEVAKKYEFNDKNVDYLAGKIIQGGAGVWGQVPMSPHPNLSKDEAAEMAKYILSLRN